MGSKNIFSKHLPNIKLATRFDAEGNEIQVEKREDVEQNKKEQEIIEILVRAGYYRACIQGLSMFDKIVGGMTWCIEACDFDVDIDLLFHENLTIGQKISLTEKIVVILPKMKCPYLIEPHQIQGLDFINIFPVIEWLVKRSAENRSEKAERLKKLSVSQFHNNFQLHSEQEIKKQDYKQIENLKRIQDLYIPKRQYRRTTRSQEDEIDRVRITLMEYGARDFSAKISVDIGKFDEEMSEDGQFAVVEEEEIDFEQLFKNLSITNEKNFLYELKDEEKQELQKNFEELKKEMSINSTQLSEQNKIKTILATKLALEKKLQRIQNENNRLKEEIQKEETDFENSRKERASLEEDIKNLDNIEITQDQLKILNNVKELVIKNEDMKHQEIEFKEKCKKELLELQEKIEKSEVVTPDDDIKENKKVLDAEKEKLQALRLQLAKKNRAFSSVQRQLDNIPDRTELAQYQRRFMELYNQVSAKHRETKQFYDLYNTLGDTKLYLEKEMNLLNSIFENYNESMLTPIFREQFLKQFEAIVEGIKTTKTKLKRRCDDEKSKRDGLNDQLICLIEQQRKYAATVKQLTSECQRNESLLKHVQQLESQMN